MAKIERFNPPPNWPVPATGWTPPADWEPDPAWGPPPDGWQLWSLARANPEAWVYSLVSAGSWYFVFLVLAFISSGGTLGAVGAVNLFVPYLVAGVVTAIIGWTRQTRWRVWIYPLVVFGIAATLNVLSFLMSMATPT